MAKKPAAPRKAPRKAAPAETIEAAPAAEPKKRGRPRKEPSTANVNPDDVLACFNDYSSLRADVARIGQRIDKMLGRYEKQGVDRAAIKRMYALAQKDPAEVARQQQRDREYAEWLDIVTVDDSGQSGFADGLAPKPKPSLEAKEKLAEARAYNDGYNTGKAGGMLEANRHHPGTAAHERWAVGWRDAEAEKNQGAEQGGTLNAPAGAGLPDMADLSREVEEELAEAAE